MFKVIKTAVFIVGFICYSTYIFAQSYCNLSISTTVSDIEGNTILPGDTICIQAGMRDYLLFRNLVGTAELPITIVNSGGESIIDTDHYYGIKFYGCRFVKLIGIPTANEHYGFNIRRVGNGAGISIDNLSTNVELAFIEISNTAIGGIYAKTDPDCSFIATRDKFTMYDIKIHDCYLHDIEDEGMYIGSSKFTGQTLTDCDTVVLPHIIEGVKVYNNVLEHTGWDGIQVSSAPTNCEIYGNLIRNDSYRETLYQMSGMLIGGGSDCDCYNNTIIDGKGDGIDIFGSNEMRIYNNLIIRAGQTYHPGNPAYPRHGIYFGTAPDNSKSSLILIFNTIIQPKSNGIRFSNTNTTGNLIHNNIVCEPGDFDTQGNAAFFNHNLQQTDFTLSNNLFTDLIEYAQFTDFTDDIYDLKAGSPAINHALDLGNTGVVFDIMNRTRPFNAGFDIGAFECHEVDAGISSQTGENDAMQIIPNPASETVTFNLNHPISGDFELLIFDNLGRRIQPISIKNYVENNRSCTLDITSFKKGIYFVLLQTDSMKFSGKLIVK